ncbi:hypothetical protein P152DRAFT_459786 [Eremomyces bilateralis CBS 781.70]|uniref:Uncharacterized protein n=1 Tax=Eremomyces bilateralis CBS 781.70 TaxID=1392243 RepID=A0A6G1G0Q6_9PEZI|nr:uncharacterized protein P152DRAFT_459786 [Eremomyces bilateralis CBS 781.70]KAF1811389.1 hypothetical protein P152DRAFT_459786 [Eremomyces bilateralis CBS 781.70]
MCNRRYQILTGLIAFVLLILFIFGESVNEIAPRPITNFPRPKIPSLPSPASIFGPPRHKEPVQANSTHGDSSWFSDFRWKNPFSSTITLEENRALLPPLRNRPEIYTYYEPSKRKDKKVSAAEEKLLLAWRRAWWAQGFKPKVLGRPEAMDNPLYLRLQQLNVTTELEFDLARLLAWGSIDSGILTNWLTLPMGPYDDHVLSFLRRGQYPRFARFDGLDGGIFYGEKNAVNNVIKNVLEKPEIEFPETKSIIQILDDETLAVEKKPKSIAYYSMQTIQEKYKAVADKLVMEDSSVGLGLLADLINSHLQIAWQNTFSDGIAVLKPFEEHIAILTFPALSLAHNLTHCSSSPIPDSCPPNIPKCKLCDPAHSLPINVTPQLKNVSAVYNIGVVPHPYTTTTLARNQELITTRFIRELGMLERDAWIDAITKDLLGSSTGAPALVRFKEAVASDYGASHSTWLTAERESHADLDWLFGFAIPGSPPRYPTHEEGLVIPEDARDAIRLGLDAALDETALNHERALLYQARQVMKSEKPEIVRVREAVEAWNLADTEVWRFARAWSARRRVERLKWEEEERNFAGAEERGGRWGWFV